MDELIGTMEAAEFMGVSPSYLRKMVAAGSLNIYPGPDKVHKMYNLEELSVLKTLREKDIDLTSVAAMAVQATLTVKKLERTVKHLMVATQLDIPLLSIDKDDISTLCSRIELALESTHYNIPDVYEWSKVFQGVGEETLDAIARYDGTEEPWAKLLALGKRMMSYGIKTSGKDLYSKAAYQLLNHGLRNARAASFFYVQTKFGSGTAFRLFPDAKGDAHDSLAMLASSMFK